MRDRRRSGAATKVQALWRGHRSRSRGQSRPKRNEAAIKTSNVRNTYIKPKFFVSDWRKWTDWIATFFSFEGYINRGYFKCNKGLPEVPKTPTSAHIGDPTSKSPRSGRCGFRGCWQMWFQDNPADLCFIWFGSGKFSSQLKAYADWLAGSLLKYEASLLVLGFLDGSSDHPVDYRLCFLPGTAATSPSKSTLHCDWEQENCISSKQGHESYLSW